MKKICWCVLLCCYSMKEGRMYPLHDDEQDQVDEAAFFTFVFLLAMAVFTVLILAMV